MDDIRICPNCREILVVEDNEVYCSVCLRQYRVEDGELVEQPFLIERS